MKSRHLLLALLLLFSPALSAKSKKSPATAKAPKEEAGFISIFDGKTLKGWEGKKKFFRVENGAIVAGFLDARIPNNEFLASKDEHGDFELRFEAKLVGQGNNAGVQFRSQRIPNNHEMIGYQCDIGGWRKGSIWGFLYDESRRRKMLAEAPQEELEKHVKSKGDWNALVVRAQGERVKIWVNGYQTVDFIEPDANIPRTGRFGLQIHSGPPAECHYRNLRFKKL